MRIIIAIAVASLFASLSYAETSATVGENEPNAVVVFGDSLSVFETLASESAWVEMLGSHLTVVDESVGGRKTNLISAAVTAYIAAGYPMRVGIIMGGTNDCNLGAPCTYTPAESLAYIQTMVSEIQAYGATPIVIAPTPVPSGADADWIAHIASLHTLLLAWTTANDILFVDGWQAFTDYITAYAELDIYPATTNVHFDFQGDLLLADTVRPVLDTVIHPPSWGCQIR